MGWFRIAKNLLLFDGVGACLTFFTTWFLLASEVLKTGLPVQLLMSMAVAALSFALFDFLALALSWDPSWSLRAISCLNGCYCSFVLLTLFFHGSTVSFVGFSYFLIEIILVLLLARWEWLVATRR